MLFKGSGWLYNSYFHNKPKTNHELILNKCRLKPKSGLSSADPSEPQSSRVVQDF